MDQRMQDLACSLGGSELIERIGEWASVTSRASSRQVAEGRVVSVYPADPQLLRRLQELIAAEAECCSFLKFEIQHDADKIVVELRVPDL